MNTRGDSVRWAVPADIPALAELVTGLFREDSARRDPSVNQEWPKRQGRALFDKALSDPNSLALIADTENAPRSGYLLGRWRSGSDFRLVDTAEIESMYVAPGARNQGIGTSLVEAFLEWSAGRGAGRLAVSAFAENTDAIRFYGRFGFQPVSVLLATTP